jgi:tetratricopeptide (TPR) repeat protein
MHIVSIASLAQDNQQVYNMYVNAVKLYEQKQIQKAMEELEKVINLDPRHKDALFDLGAMNLEVGNKERAIHLLQGAVRLKDRAAADILKKQLGQRIAYYDTMSIDDVDIKPFILLNSKPEEIISEKGLQISINKQLADGIKKSKILKKEAGNRELLVLALYTSKEGELDATLIKGNINKEANEELLKIIKSVNNIIPAQYEGKPVVVQLKGILPVKFY